jgi:hypothetical protein
MYNQASHVITYDINIMWIIWMLYMKHGLHEWNITYATYETSLMPHMKHHLCNTWNTTYATIKMQLTCSWMKEWCLCSCNASEKCKLNTGVLQPQCRLNNAMREVVKKEVLKLLHAGIIYPMPYSEWVSPVQVVPKKGRMTMVKKEKEELIPQRTVTGWQICIDY